VLSVQTVLEREGLVVSDVRCTHAQGCATEPELASGHAVVFVRRGCFVRNVEGTEQVLDPTLAYCMNPADEQRFDHPHSDGDDCTAVSLSGELAASLAGGDPALPARAIPTSPRIDLRHRLLLGAMRHRHDEHELYEAAVMLVAGTIEGAAPHLASAGRPRSAQARRALADGVREALTADPDRSLAELARALSTSPHHLSRVFVEVAGHTISRQRMRLRTRAALERLAAGADDLARVAAEAGFADQSHFCRVVRDETGSTPSALRRALSREACGS
jgi:AraC-like DNA-binding protein